MMTHWLIFDPRLEFKRTFQHIVENMDDSFEEDANLALIYEIII